MLTKTLEFMRLADLQPTDEKLRNRIEAAKELVGLISDEGNRSILLACVQGIVGGFAGPIFTQDSPAVAHIYKAIKDRDTTLPSDLTENATELRAVAGIAVGELLTAEAKDGPADEAVLAALSIHSALSFRPEAADKHIRWMLEILLTASGKVLRSAATRRRYRGTAALAQLEDMEKPAEGADLWDELSPVITSALQEARDRESINREEIETLWWMFAAYSEVEQKSLASLTALTAALCSAFELAERALLPPFPMSVAMVKRAAESGRKPEELAAISLQDATAGWSEGMSNCLLAAKGSADNLVRSYPSLFPLTWVCHRLREGVEIGKIGKEAKTAIGVAMNHTLTPSDWGAQAFREKILQRFLADAERS